MMLNGRNLQPCGQQRIKMLLPRAFDIPVKEVIAPRRSSGLRFKTKLLTRWFGLSAL